MTSHPGGKRITLSVTKKIEQMTKLEDLLPTAAVRGVLPDELVTVVSALG